MKTLGCIGLRLILRSHQFFAPLSPLAAFGLHVVRVRR
eukprot:COSAG06_NODE_16317_length_1007_cov_2.609031_2_plen_37_part_01